MILANEVMLATWRRWNATLNTIACEKICSLVCWNKKWTNLYMAVKQLHPIRYDQKIAQITSSYYQESISRLNSLFKQYFRIWLPFSIYDQWFSLSREIVCYICLNDVCHPQHWSSKSSFPISGRSWLPSFNPVNEINPETARTKLGDIIQTLTKR